MFTSIFGQLCSRMNTLLLTIHASFHWMGFHRLLSHKINQNNKITLFYLFSHLKTKYQILTIVREVVSFTLLYTIDLCWCRFSWTF